MKDELTQEAGAVCNSYKIHQDRDHPGKLLHPCSYQKTPMGKSGRQGSAQEAPRSPQGCPLGPKFWSQKFSHMTLI